MENQDIFNQIKSAAENPEPKDFTGMEKVWNRVEEKLDTKASKTAAWRWKKIAVAASLLLMATLGYQFFKNDADTLQPNTTVTQTDPILKTAPATDAVRPSRAAARHRPRRPQRPCR